MNIYWNYLIQIAAPQGKKNYHIPWLFHECSQQKNPVAPQPLGPPGASKGGRGMLVTKARPALGSLLEAVSHCTIQPTMYTYVYKYRHICTCI
jgi:hypothetical protein